MDIAFIIENSVSDIITYLLNCSFSAISSLIHTLFFKEIFQFTLKYTQSDVHTIGVNALLTSSAARFYVSAFL